jgi:hypothetical protein
MRRRYQFISGCVWLVYNSEMARHLHLQARLLTLLLLTVLLLVLMAALVASGQMSASAGTGTPLCARNVPAGTLPTALHVERTSYDQQFPTTAYCVRDVAEVQRLYAAALALPVVPANTFSSCPKSVGLVYHLTFLGTSTPVESMDLQGDGCHRLTIGTEGHATNPSFLSLFIKTLGIPSLVPGVVGFSPTTERGLVSDPSGFGGLLYAPTG